MNWITEKGLIRLIVVVISLPSKEFCSLNTWVLEII
jgi:hypothetical protein